MIRCATKVHHIYLESYQIRKVKKNWSIHKAKLEFPGGTVDKNLPASAADRGSISDPARFHMSWSLVVKPMH